ncbi:MAG: minichromosome maintenance protein MCM [Methanolobus sp.]|uniref:minichromosome maintenance protein MCM n=1 Tax=Methanolobus sp. TaxID=1874737 RepID=UPI002732152F|nr:minichromosome maintenance protein MCM [Methanolobus sp.]MDP2217982.1 minichromosome maintenance protein MCM [Methanolobus sp.]
MTEGKWDEKFRTFLKKYYWDSILQLANDYPDQRSIYVDFSDLEIFDRELADELLLRPDEVTPCADSALLNIDLPIEKSLDNAKVRFIRIPNKVPNRDLRSKHLLQLVAIEGMIRKATEVRPKIVSAAFKCMRCEHVTRIPQTELKFVEPLECENDTCGRKGPFKLDINESVFIDAQKLQVQESPENLRGGTQPQSLDVDVEDDLAGIVKPGDRVIINGVLRSHQRTTREGKSPFYDLVLHANSLEYMDQEFDELEITPEEEEQIRALSRNPEIYEKIIKSIAPSIYGYEDVKEALSLQLFSGVAKHLPDGSRVRGDIHMLFVGDPGVAKSQMLRYMVKLAPRGVFASGKSASSSGLTAAAVKDDLGDGRWTLEAGALVMADMGIAAIDEMDKMSTEDKSALHEAMEQQTISVAKAGIIATLKSRCALLGAANPKYGRFDKYEGIAQQINMPPALLSRFDMIFVLLDTPNEEMDSKIAKHILKAHYAGELSEQRRNIPSSKVTQELVDEHMEVVKPDIDPELMRKYVAYSRRHIYPIMEEAAREHLVKFYMDLRKMGEGKDSPVPITARQLEALVRLAEARARVRLSNVATLDDAKKTTRMVYSCLKQVGVDPDTGALDVDVIASGTSKSQRDKIKVIREIIKAVGERHSGGKAPLEEVFAEAQAQQIDRQHAEELIAKMRRSGDLVTPDNDHIKVV